MTEPVAKARGALVARLRRRAPSFPWLTSLVCACVLWASAPSSGWRDGLANVLIYWAMLLFLGFLGALLLPGWISYIVRHNQPENVINEIRVAQVVMILAVALLWGWTPATLPGDPGDRYP